MKTFQKQMQSGRSMVEMIGVIAIMGLLSVGGIYGYRQAYNSYRATALKDIVLQGKVVVDTNKRGATANTLQLYAQKTSLNCSSGSCAKMTESGRTKTFSLFSQETSGVCEKIIERKQEFEDFNIKVEPNSCGESTVNMTFSFEVKVRGRGSE